MSLEHDTYMEDLLDEVGGLGLFQWIMIIVILGSEFSVASSMLMMTFGAADPNWHCEWTDFEGMEYTNKSYWKTCDLENTTVPVQCSSKVFEKEMETVVSEWDLVCEEEWVVGTITSIQMAGLVVGSFFSGQISDSFGRKSTYFSTLFILPLVNLLAAFSTSWQMFAACRFFIGVACGFYQTIYVTYLIEFTPRKFRPMILALPTWGLHVCIFAGICWWLHDWKYVQIAIAISGVPFALAVCFVPESYRWLVSNGRIKKSFDVVQQIAKVNRRPVPDQKKFEQTAFSNVEIQSKQKQYTLMDLVKHRKYLKYTFLLAIGWTCCGYGYYVISFGVEQLSGNLYLNMILINVMDCLCFVIWYFTNCIGRKWTTFVFLFIGGAVGAVVGIIQFIDLSNKDNLVIGFALASKFFVFSGWSALMLFTSELYPTVIRNIGYGIHNGLSTVGGMIAPQLVYASENIPGLSYLTFAGLMFLSAFLTLPLPETNRTVLKDTLDISIVVPSHGTGGIPNPAYTDERFDIAIRISDNSGKANNRHCKEEYESVA